MIRRPAIPFMFAYGAGLVTGLSHFLDTALALGVVAVFALGASRRAPGLAALLVVAALGRVAGSTTAGVAALGCAARLPAGPVTVVARIVDPLPADTSPALGSVTLPGAGCQGSLWSRWRASPGGLDAGSMVRISGRWIPDSSRWQAPGGLLLVDSAAIVSRSPSPAERLRTWVVLRIRALYGGRSPTVEALLLNRRSAMDPELRDQYARSGLVHLLSISGFHVGLIALWIVLALRLVARWWPGLPGTGATAPLVAAGVSTLYVGFLGWPAPATRAALLVAVLAAERYRQRQVDGESLLAAIALLLMLADPWSVLNLGAWLSFLSLWGASRCVAWSDRALGGHAVARLLAGSVGATAATAPVTAAVLGRVSLAGIVLNLAAIPLAAVVVPGLIASLLVSPIAPPVARAFAAGGGLGLAAMDGLARLGATIPGLSVVQPAVAASALPWLLVLGFLLWAMGSGTTSRVAARRVLLAVTAVTWLGLGWQSLVARADEGSGLTLHFLDVGQGDGAIIHTPGGQWIVVDAGPAGDQGDAGRMVVVPALERAGAQRVALLVVSHAHADHLGGVPAVLHRFPADVVLDPGDPVSDRLYLGFLDELAERGDRWRAARAGDTLVVDSVRVVVLHPSAGWPEFGLDLNEDSAVLRLEYGGCRVLMAGDAGLIAEAAMRGHAGPVDLLKVGHHGSRTATGQAWLDELAPEAAIISVGAHNRYGHPAPETGARLAANGIGTWRTDREGTITVRIRDGRLEVSGRRTRQQYACHAHPSP
ncbi:MAG: DNA internalization-related competence protein ComEC/Rec2 [Gemmatimonadales bacterium]